jgi:hypothetical protein
LRKSWKPIQCALVYVYQAKYPNPYKSIINYLKLARFSHQFWDNSDVKVSHTIAVINLELYNAPERLIDYLISVFPIVEQNGLGQYRIVLQGDRDIAWERWTEDWIGRGYENIKEEVTLVITDKVAYYKDELGRNIDYYLNFCTHIPSIVATDRDSEIMPWFRLFRCFLEFFHP